MTSNQSNTRIQQIAEIISSSVNKIQAILTAQNLPTPSFDEDAPSTLPLDLSDAQDAVLDATAELRDLLTEPMTLIHSHGGVSSPTLEVKPLATDGLMARRQANGTEQIDSTTTRCVSRSSHASALLPWFRPTGRCPSPILRSRPR